MKYNHQQLDVEIVKFLMKNTIRNVLIYTVVRVTYDVRSTIIVIKTANSSVPFTEKTIVAFSTVETYISGSVVFC